MTATAWATLIRRRLSAQGRRAARFGSGSGALQRRSLDARRGRTPGAKRLADPGCQDHLENSGCCRFSYAAAEPLLAALGGRVAPPAWHGGLPLTYHVGPGPAKVHMKVLSDWNQKTLYDVIAKMRGSEEPDRWIIRGNHHDGWVFGATDPLAGQTALMAEAKAIGTLVKQGWRPRRTLVYASWDEKSRACSVRPSGPNRTPRNLSQRP